MDRHELLLKAITTYGVDAQKKQLIEECGELIVAILHWNRNKCSLGDVVTEIADVMIMCEQMRIIYGEHAVDIEVERKLQRLAERLK